MESIDSNTSLRSTRQTEDTMFATLCYRVYVNLDGFWVGWEGFASEGRARREGREAFPGREIKVIAD